jgi:hypothetical protein
VLPVRPHGTCGAVPTVPGSAKLGTTCARLCAKCTYATCCLFSGLARRLRPPEPELPWGGGGRDFVRQTSDSRCLSAVLSTLAANLPDFVSSSLGPPVPSMEMGGEGAKTNFGQKNGGLVATF